MKTATLLLACLLPLGAQIASKPAAVSVVTAGTPTPSMEKLRIPLKTFYGVERECDYKLRGIGEPNTVDLLGATRGIYLDGYGAVFTSEITLVAAMPITPFHQNVTRREIDFTHQKMLERLPRLREVVKEVARSAAAALSAVPENQQIVVAVRLDYLNWEDTSGLPGLVMLKADRRSAASGAVQIEEQ